MIQIKKNKVNLINFLLVLIGIVIFIQITKKSEFAYFVDRVNTNFFFSFFFFFLSIFFASIRFFFILKKKIKLPKIFVLNIQSFFFYFFLPVGIGSDIYRYNILRRDLKKKKIQIFSIILIDRTFGLISFLILSTIFFILIIKNFLFLFLLFLMPLFIIILNFTLKKYDYIRLQIMNQLEINEIVFAIFFSIISQIFLILSIYSVVFLYGFNFDFIYSGFVISFSSILSLIPLSLLGLSATELSSYTLYNYYGLDSNQSLFLTLNHYFLKFFFSIIGVFFFLKDNFLSK